MKDKKNIDKLFNEGFKNFETSPSPRVWENIQIELNKEKRNRKPVPLWIKYGGVAALLALLLTVGNWVFNPFESHPNSITNENIVYPVDVTQENTDKLILGSPEKQVVTENGDIQNRSTLQNRSTQNISTPETKSQIENVPKNKNASQSVKKSTKTVIASGDVKNDTSEKTKTQQKGLNEKNHQNTKADKNTAISKTTSDIRVKNGEQIDSRRNSNEQIINNGKVISEEADERISIAEEAKENPVQTEITQDSKNEKSILDAIAEKEEADDNLLENKKQKPEHRWNVAPNVAPVYYSSLGNGSSIDPDFSNNPQKGDVNMSYGLQVSYALSNRLSVRTGVNNVDLSYSTSDIVIGTGPVGMALRSVDYGSNQIVVTALNRESLTNGSLPSNAFGDITLKSTAGDARLIQNINYYEVPLELKYAVFNNKFGINLIGGVSTLFLGNNEISVKSDNFNSVLGEANNLSSVSFSTNVGLGLDYKISKRFIFNVEPMFKYQLNPYTDSSVNFKPYYLGVYSGLSFKF